MGESKDFTDGYNSGLSGAPLDSRASDEEKRGHAVGAATRERWEEENARAQASLREWTNAAEERARSRTLEIDHLVGCIGMVVVAAIIFVVVGLVRFVRDPEDALFGSSHVAAASPSANPESASPVQTPAESAKPPRRKKKKEPIEATKKSFRAVPEQPVYSGQFRPDANGKCKFARDVAINGGCWYPTGDKAPCDQLSYEWEGKCYEISGEVPTPSAQSEPQ